MTIQYVSLFCLLHSFYEMHFRFTLVAVQSSSNSVSILQVDSIVAAEYELEYLLLEGHCYDVTTGQPPRGLQFTLGTSTNPVIVDTIVMANLVNNQFIKWR